MEGPEGRVVCQERLLALRRGEGPVGRGSSGVTSWTVLFNFLLLQTLSHTTHSEYHVVSGDSLTILSRDVA